jgi:hypothetical protein
VYTEHGRLTLKRSPLNYPVLLVEVNLASVTKLTTAFCVCLKGKITKLADSKQINSVPEVNCTYSTNSPVSLTFQNKELVSRDAV